MARADEDTEVERQNWHWRNSMRPVRFVNLDARASFPLLLLLFHARLSTLILALSVLAIFYFMERKGLTFPSALRALRVWIIGVDRPAWLPLRRRKRKDYG